MREYIKVISWPAYGDENTARYALENAEVIAKSIFVDREFSDVASVYHEHKIVMFQRPQNQKILAVNHMDRDAYRIQTFLLDEPHMCCLFDSHDLSKVLPGKSFSKIILSPDVGLDDQLVSNIFHLLEDGGVVTMISSTNHLLRQGDVLISQEDVFYCPQGTKIARTSFARKLMYCFKVNAMEYAIVFPLTKNLETTFINNCVHNFNALITHNIKSSLRPSLRTPENIEILEKKFASVKRRIIEGLDTSNKKLDNHH